MLTASLNWTRASSATASCSQAGSFRESWAISFTFQVAVKHNGGSLMKGVTSRPRLGRLCPEAGMAWQAGRNLVGICSLHPYSVTSLQRAQPLSQGSGRTSSRCDTLLCHFYDNFYAKLNNFHMCKNLSTCAASIWRIHCLVADFMASVLTVSLNWTWASLAAASCSQPGSFKASLITLT